MNNTSQELKMKIVKKVIEGNKKRDNEVMYKSLEFMEEINKLVQKSDLKEIKNFLESINLDSIDVKDKENNLIVFKVLLNSNNVNIVKFALDYFPKDFLKDERYFFNDVSSGDDSSFEIYKYLYNHFEANLTEQDKYKILFTEFISSNRTDGDFRIIHFLVNEKVIDLNKSYPVKVFDMKTKKYKISHHWNYLFACMLSKKYEFTKYVLENLSKENINFRDHNGETALFKAVENEKLLELLLQYGADPNIKNDLGISIKDKLTKQMENSQKLLNIIDGNKNGNTM